MILHRHEFARFLRENPDALMITCHCSECPVATWLDAIDPEHAHEVKLNRVSRWHRTQHVHVDATDTPTWARLFIRTLDTTARTREPVTSADCLEILGALAADA